MRQRCAGIDWRPGAGPTDPDTAPSCRAPPRVPERSPAPCLFPQRSRANPVPNTGDHRWRVRYRTGNRLGVRSGAGRTTMNAGSIVPSGTGSSGVAGHPDAAPPVPHVHYAAAQDNPPGATLLREDLTAGHAGDNLDGRLADETMLAVAHLARFPARWSRNRQSAPGWIPSRTVNWHCAPRCSGRRSGCKVIGRKPAWMHLRTRGDACVRVRKARRSAGSW
jgi:hypothetical protein